MKPLRFNLDNDLDYISPMECEAVRNTNHKVIFVKVRSGKDFAIAVDQRGQLYSWGNNVNGALGHTFTSTQANPSKIPYLEHSRVIDFDCGDNFSVVILLRSEKDIDNNLYREFKYNSNQRIIRKILWKEKRSKSQAKLKKKKIKSHRIRTLEEDDDEFFELEGEKIVKVKVDPVQIQNYILKNETIFNFKNAITKKNEGAISYNNIEDKVKEFFGLIDFTKLPLHLLSLDDYERKTNLQIEVKRMVKDLCTYNNDFKNFLKQFDKIAKMVESQPNINFDSIFFNLIMNEPIIKKIIPTAHTKRQKQRITTRGMSDAKRIEISHYRDSMSKLYNTEEPFDEVTAMVYDAYDQKDLMMKNKPAKPVSTLSKNIMKGNIIEEMKYKSSLKRYQSMKRLKSINNLKYNGIRIKVQQRQITQNFYRKRRLEIEEKKRDDTIKKIDQKLEKNVYLKKLKREKERRLILYRAWQEEWLGIVSLIFFMKKIKLVVKNSESMIIQSVNYLEAIVRIQRYWKKRCIYKRISFLSLRQKFSFIMLSSRAKKTVKLLKKKKAIKKVMQTLTINLARKKMRLGCSRVRKSLNQIRPFVQFAIKCYRQRSKIVSCLWDQKVLEVKIILMIESQSKN